MECLEWKIEEFVKPLQRTGSLSGSYTYLLEGIKAKDEERLFQKVQNRLKKEISSYESQIEIEEIFSWKDYQIRIFGNLNGFIDGVLAENIKITSHVPSLLNHIQKDPQHIYFLEIGMYLWLLSRKKAHIHGRLRVVSSVSEEETLWKVPFESDRVEKWFFSYLEKRILFVEEKEDLFLKKRNLSSSLVFPFSTIRAPQKKMMEDVSLNIEKYKFQVIHAPTGIGKTIGMLLPALVYALSHDLRVFYATPRNSHLALAQDAFLNLRKQSDLLKGVLIYAKEKMCLNDKIICDEKHCPYAKKYYDRALEEKVMDVWLEKGFIHPEDALEMGKEKTLCPYELLLDYSLFCDLIIGDYNYIFAPRSKLQRHFGEEVSQKCVVLLDEAHHLYSRSQSWFSHVLSVQMVLSLFSHCKWEESFQVSFDVRRRLKLIESKNKKMLGRLLGFLEDLKGPTRKVEVDENELYKIFNGLRDVLKSLEEEDFLLPNNHPLIQMKNMLQDMADILSRDTSSYVIWWNTAGQGALHLSCADASHYLLEQYSSVEKVIAFSATMKPFVFHENLCGWKENSIFLEYSSPFPRENRKILIIPQIDTTYKARLKSLPKIAEVIQRLSKLKVGNYFVFVSSYEFMDQLLGEMQKTDLKDLFHIEAQPRSPKVSDVDEFIMKLKTSKNNILLCVQGSAFTEGIDCPGDELIGAFVVGPPLPVFDFERESMKEIYELRYQRGFFYAYVVPAMTKVVQSAGRVCRTMTDTGLMVCMDARFLQKEYVECLPQDWCSHIQELVSSSLLKEVSSFWEGK